MPLELVTGPANASKAGVVLGRFREEAESGSAPVLVVPTTADRDAYEAELLEAGALIGGRVLTWERFVRDLARRSGVEGRVIGPIRRRLIVRELVADAIDEKRLDRLAGSAASPGFPDALERLLLEHSRGLMDDDRLFSHLADSDVDRAKETMGLVRAYFQRLHEEQILDRDLQARRALDRLEADPSHWNGEPVLFYGFSDLTAVQAGAIAALSKTSSVVVSLPTEETRKVGVADLAVERLKLSAGSEIAFHDQPPVNDEGTLSQLSSGLFAQQPGSSIPNDGSLSVGFGSGARATAELAASFVLRFLEEGMEANQIAVVRPHGDWDALLEAILRDAGVEVARPESSVLAATTLGRSLIALCRVALQPESATADDALVWMRLAAGSGSSLEVDAIEADVRKFGISAAKEAIAKWQARGFPLDRLRALESANNPKAYADALTTAADQLMKANLTRRGAQLERDSLFDANVVSSVAKASADLGDLASAKRADLMIEELGALNVDVDTGAPRPGAVQFTDPSSIRARSFDAVVVLGMEQGLFPAASSPDAFLADAPADSLGRAALAGDEDSRATSSARRQEAGERERFVACFARARKHVALVGRNKDDGGSAIAASPFLEEAMRLVGMESSEATERLAGSLSPIGAGSQDRSHLRLEAARAGMTVPAKLPPYLDEAAQAAIASQEDKVISPSRIEQYCQCPLSWVGQNLLKPDELAPEPEPTFRGTTVHLALQRAVGVAIERNNGVVDESILDDARKAIRAAIEERRVDAARTLAAEVALERAELLSMEWLAKEAGRDWTPNAQKLEFAFGREDEETKELNPSLKLAEGIEIRGTVDRIDVVERDGKKLVYVRDYKSGNADYPASKWAEMRIVQAPIYLMAALELVGEEAKPAAAFYDSVRNLSLAGGIVEGVPGATVDGPELISAEELNEYIEEAKVRVITAVQGMRDGNLGPDPEHCSGGQGRGCKYPWLCRAGR